MGVLLVGALAEAHRPHTPVTALAAAPGQPAWLSLESDHTTQIMRSDDAGWSWDAVVSPAKADLMLEGAALPGVVAFATDDATLWIADAQGATWRSLPMPQQPVRLRATGDGALLVVASTSARLLDPTGQEMASITTGGRWIDGDRSTDQTLLVATDGRLWSWTDALRLVEAPAGVTAVAAGDSGLLVRAADTLWVQHEGTWSVCAALPVDAPGENADALGRIGTTYDRAGWVVTTGQQIFSGSADCASWAAWPLPDDLIVEFGAEVGSISDPEDAWLAWVGDPEQTIAVGWLGAAAVHDGVGRSSPTLTESYVRGLAFAPAWPVDPRIFFGGYGGGVRSTSDGGATWDGTAAGTVGLFVYDLVVTAPPERVVFSGNYVVHTSYDGETWTFWDDPPLDRVQALAVDGQEIWALGGDNAETGAGHLARSRDAGRTWARVEAFDAVAAQPEELFRTTLHGRDVIVVSTFKPAAIATSEDDGATWTTRFSDDTPRAATATAWPLDHPFRLIAATSGGVVFSDDLGATWRGPARPPEGDPHLLTTLRDGTVLVMLLTGAASRSTDGGETWSEPGQAIAPATFSIVGAPHADHAGTLLAATKMGAYWSTDHGDTWIPLPRAERYEDQELHLACATSIGSPCATYDATNAGNWGGYLLEVGDALTFTCRGHEARLGGPGDDGVITVTIDGVEGPEVPARAPSLPLGADDWHDVAITLKAGSAVPVDRVDCRDATPPIVIPGVEATGGCGGGSSAAVALVVLWGPRRRAVTRAR